MGPLYVLTLYITFLGKCFAIFQSKNFKVTVSEQGVFSTVYVFILDQLLVPKILDVLVCAACYKNALSRLFLDRRVII